MKNKLMLKLTAEQQQQIKAATGKEVKELSLDASALTAGDLEGVVGGHTE